MKLIESRQPAKAALSISMTTKEATPLLPLMYSGGMVAIINPTETCNQKKSDKVCCRVPSSSSFSFQPKASVIRPNAVANRLA